MWCTVSDWIRDVAKFVFDSCPLLWNILKTPIEVLRTLAKCSFCPKTKCQNVCALLKKKKWQLSTAMKFLTFTYRMPFLSYIAALFFHHSFFHCSLYCKRPRTSKNKSKAIKTKQKTTLTEREMAAAWQWNGGQVMHHPSGILRKQM